MKGKCAWQENKKKIKLKKYYPTICKQRIMDRVGRRKEEGDSVNVYCFC